MSEPNERPFRPLALAVVTLTDTRTAAEDRSGDLLVSLATDAGHRIVDRRLLPDDRAGIEATLRAYGTRSDVDVVLTTGGTGITGRDVTPEALESVASKMIPGFGELFRYLSFAKIGASTIQSRATAGVVGTTLVFVLPGSTGAVRDAWEGILASQLDSRTRPCNFSDLLPRIGER